MEKVEGARPPASPVAQSRDMATALLGRTRTKRFLRSALGRAGRPRSHVPNRCGPDYF